ncbi:chemotaxis protein CheW [Azohydromonas aeria]|uniref:chemotaxis protein CheW n=1 Tax=Azohydromonas aeria TaxID=2590212 RepID=UPI001E46B7C4|nr:chemotaxis protein CheW [Azohydromonas aeria]
MSNQPEMQDDAAADDGAGMGLQFVTFAVAGEMFAVPMAPVQEIIRVPEVARLPLAPAVLDGLANLRGRVLPIISLRRLFGCEAQANDDATRAVVINLGQPLGFVVDRVASVVSVEPGEIEPAEQVQSVLSADYLTGVIKRALPEGGTEMLLVVDFTQLIRDQFRAIGTAAAEQGASGADSGAHDAALDEDAVASDELRLVSFSVAGQEYALDIAEVQEIVQFPEQFSVLPNAPGHVVGLMSLRQRLLPLVSLRGLFGLAPVDAEVQQRIVVTTLPGNLHVGLVTDAVKEVMSVPRAQAEPMPGLLARQQEMQEFSAICRLDQGKRLVSVIATDRLLQVPGMRQALAQGAGAAATDEIRNEDDVNDVDNQDAGNDADDDTQLVIFRLGAEEFGVPIMSVQEIVRVPPTLTRVPRTPAFVEGVINLRGTVLPVVDQRARLGLPVIERNEGQRIMVYLLDGVRTGFIVDSVAEVLRIPRGQITPAPALSQEQSRLIGRVANLDGGKRLVMLIEPSQLLHGSELQAVSGLGRGGAATVHEEDDALPLAA